jgi:hypothetical protein
MKDLNQLKWGWIKDQPDARDFQAKRFVYAELPVPTNYFVNPNTPVYNQGSHPACVGYSCAGVKTDEEFIQHKNIYTFDGLWLYNACKKIDGIPDVGGTYLRFAMQILQQHGMRQTSLPCKSKKPDPFWQIKAYFRIDNSSNPAFIKQVIFQYGSIAVGSYWYTSWMNVKNIFPAADTTVGGHAYRICGWRDDTPTGWIVVNSWGKLLWGNKGIAIMPYDMFTADVLGCGADVWKLIDA